MGFLTEIVGSRRRDLAARPLDVAELMDRIAAAPAPRDLEAALRARRPAVIAEIKRSSPSAGDIASQVDPVSQARAYSEAGAAAISVLTEPRHFGGSLDDLAVVRASVQVPVLRKDFVIDRSQVLQARAWGADALLLITAALSDDELRVFMSLASELGMTCLVETHGDVDLERALASGARIVGVNARDLETLEVDVPRALAQLARIPSDRVAVMESGIATRSDVSSAVEAGASAILVGETLMRAVDPRATLRRLIGEESLG